jgi:hypothetical protein
MNPEPGEDWTLIGARYEGYCLECHEIVEVGERVWWKKDTGVRHELCGKPLPPLKRDRCEGCTVLVPTYQLVDGLCSGCR